MYEALLDALDSGASVITGNNRLARTLRHAYDERQIASGLSAWASPDIISWNPWLQRLWDESRLRGGSARELTLLTDSAADCVWQQAVGDDADTGRVAPLARNARATWGLLNEWDGLTAEEWTRPDLSPDQRAWLRWSGTYRNRCRVEGWIDREQLASVLTADIRAGLFADLSPMVFAGIDEWSPARSAMLTALRQCGVQANIAESRARNQRRWLRPAANHRDELRAAALWAREHWEADPARAIGVVIHDLGSRAADVRRVFLDVFAPEWRVSGVPAGLPLNISYGRPLLELPAVATACRLLQLGSGRASFDEFSLLLRSALLDGAMEEADERALLEIRLREELRVDFRLGTALARFGGKAPRFASLLERLLEFSRNRRSQPAEDWARDYTALLQSAGWPGSVSLDSETWQTVKAWNDLLGDFAASASVLGPLRHAEALAVLRAMAGQRLFQPEGVPGAVQVMGVLEAAGHEFDVLWLCGMSRELWPGAAKPDAFVPLELQRRLGMPDATAGRTLEYAVTQASRLGASADELHVSWPQSLDGEPLGPSPLFSNDSVQTRAVDVSPGWNEILLAAGRLERLDPDPPPPLQIDGPMRGGAGVLSLQAASPLNAFIEKRLGAFEMRQPVVGINAMQRGNLTHRALEDFYNQHPTRSAAIALGAEARVIFLEESLRRGLAELPGINEPFMQRLAVFELQQQLDRLQSFLDIDLARDDFTVSEREEMHTVSIGPLSLRLKLDRLDTLDDGRLLVVDYKTGRVSRQSWNPDKPRDMQLPLYVTAVVPDAAAVAFAQVSSRGIGYDGVGSGDIPINGLRAPGARQKREVRFQYPRSDIVIEDWDELKRTWAEVLEALADKFAKGDFELDPRNPDSARGQFAILSRIFDAGMLLAEDDE